MANRGYELILARLKSHPEEFDFYYDAGSHYVNAINPKKDAWQWIMNEVQARASNIRYRQEHGAGVLSGANTAFPFLSDEEILHLTDEFMLAQGDSFTRRVMALVLDAEDGSNNSQPGVALAAVQPSPPPTSSVSPHTYTSATVRAQLNALQAMMKAQQVETDEADEE